MEETFVTKEKHEELSEELNFLKKTKRKEIAKNLEYARSLGDLSENAEYHSAREAQAELEARIFQLDSLLKSATIVAKRKDGTIGVGSTVVLVKDGTKDKRTFMLVGAEEADMSAGKISPSSPMGQAIFGHKKGDKVSFLTPSRKEIFYKITSVE